MWISLNLDQEMALDIEFNHLEVACGNWCYNQHIAEVTLISFNCGRNWVGHEAWCHNLSKSFQQPTWDNLWINEYKMHTSVCSFNPFPASFDSNLFASRGLSCLCSWTYYPLHLWHLDDPFVKDSAGGVWVWGGAVQALAAPGAVELMVRSCSCDICGLWLWLWSP